MSTTTAAPATTGYQGSEKLLWGIVLAVVTFWLFAGTTGTVAPAIMKDVGVEAVWMNLAVSITALFSGLFIVLMGGTADRIGPFPYAKDGIVFGNRERVLPRRERGFYREYTVRTPGSRDRGARRIVCGGRQPTDPEACFYTADHYASFQRIAP